MTRKRSIGAEIIEGLGEAVAYERGAPSGARVKRAPITAREAAAEPAPRFTSRRIAALRSMLGLSQPVFAMALNVSPEAPTRRVTPWA